MAGAEVEQEGGWTPEENVDLAMAVAKYGANSWSEVARKVGLESERPTTPWFTSIQCEMHYWRLLNYFETSTDLRIALLFEFSYRNMRLAAHLWIEWNKSLEPIMVVLREEHRQLKRRQAREAALARIKATQPKEEPEADVPPSSPASKFHAMWKEIRGIEQPNKPRKIGQAGPSKEPGQAGPSNEPGQAGPSKEQDVPAKELVELEQLGWPKEKPEEEDDSD